MFQYAALRGIAHKGYNWMIPPEDVLVQDNYGLHGVFKLTHCKPENVGEQQTKLQLSWREFHYNQDLMDNIPDGIDVDGCSKQRDGSHIEDEIREDFAFKDEWLDPCLEYIEEKIGNKKLVSLHIRRGNPNLQGERGEKWSYQLLQHTHPLMKQEYYERLSHFGDDYQVLVFSDVIDWCKKQPWLQGDRFLFSDNSKMLFEDGATLFPYVDLCLMSLCSDAVCQR